MSLFSLFMNTFGDVDRKRIIRVLDFYSEQYLTYGYVDSSEVFESVYSSIYSISEAVKAFRNIMDSFYVCLTNMTSTSMSGTSFVTIP